MITEEVREWARVLKTEWTTRSQSRRRRFYIASHPGWESPEAWNRQAEIDASFVLLGLDDEALRHMAVLEIGCGNGRLVRALAPRIGSYSGFDLCPDFVAEARAGHAGFGRRLRFVEGDGAAIPLELRDRQYDLVFAAAVFIHCPLPVITSYLEQARELVAPGGRFRFQVLADPEDGGGYVPAEALAANAEASTRDFVDEVLADQAAAAEEELVEGGHYEGHRFGHRELLDLLNALAPRPSTIHVLRFDPLIFNCEIALP